MYHQQSSLFSGSTFLVIALLLIAFAIVSYILTGIALSTVAKEQGRTDGFLGWIPIANTYLLIQVAGGNPWFMLLFIGAFLPYIGVICSLVWSVYTIVMIYQLSNKYLDKFLGYFIAGIFISPFILVLYYKIYKSALGRMNGIGAAQEYQEY